MKKAWKKTEEMIFAAGFMPYIVAFIFFFCVAGGAYGAITVFMPEVEYVKTELVQRLLVEVLIITFKSWLIIMILMLVGGLIIEGMYRLTLKAICTFAPNSRLAMLYKTRPSGSDAITRTEKNIKEE